MRAGRFTVVAIVLALLALSCAGKSISQQKNLAKSEPGRGETIFEGHCAFCHGFDGGGGRGPSLHRARLEHASDEKSLRAVIANGIYPSMPEAWYLTDAEIDDVAGYVKGLGRIPPEKAPGDSTKGAEVYSRRRCNMCHILAGAGNDYGPELTEIGSKRGIALLEEAIRHPALVLPAGFLMAEAITSSGEIIRGVRLNEDSFTIQLKDLSGRVHSFRKSELKELQKLRGQTPMPSYEQSLAPDEIQNLVAYLAAQRGPE